MALLKNVSQILIHPPLLKSQGSIRSAEQFSAAQEHLTSFQHRYGHGVSICIPAYNEEYTIEDAVKKASEALQLSALPGEILVLDDCSADQTWEILQRLTRRVPKMQTRRHEANRGIAETFRELCQWAHMSLVFLNSADGQWKMELLLEMLPAMQHYDLVVARRKQKQYTLNRLIISWLFNVLPLFLFQTRTYDAGSVKLVRREIYDMPLKSRGVFAEAERIIRASRKGYRIGFVDVEHLPRKSGKATGAKLSLVVEAVIDLFRCWIDIVLLRRI